MSRYNKVMSSSHNAKLSIQWLPRWLLATYVAVIVVLIPWIVYLSYSLPARHVARHWDAVWIGFDLVLLAALVATAYLGSRRSVWIVMPAMALTVLLVVDIWFDTLTARPGRQLAAALGLGIGAELPLAGLSLWLVVRTMQHLLGRRRSV